VRPSPVDPPWWADAACAGQPLQLFFPAPYVSQSEAKAICYGCPVRAECVSDALTTHETAGIRGGFGMGDRRGRRRASQWLEDALKVSDNRSDTAVAS